MNRPDPDPSDGAFLATLLAFTLIALAAGFAFGWAVGSA